jgi:hypothetical protein
MKMVPKKKNVQKKIKSDVEELIINDALVEEEADILEDLIEEVGEKLIEIPQATFAERLSKIVCPHCEEVQDRQKSKDSSSTWCIKCQRAFLTDGDKNNVIRRDRWTQS